MPSKKQAEHPSYDFTAQRLYIDHPLQSGETCQCETQQVNYLINVLRLRTGDQIYVFNGKDGEWSAEVESPKKNKCALHIKEQVRTQNPPQDIEYLFAPIKRARLDYMVQKATELGVSSLRPVITRRTIVDRINESRMKSNIIEAAEQCGILNIPEMAPSIKLADLLDSWPQDRTLIFCDEAAVIKSPLTALKSAPNQPVSILIGPEGGFDDYEREKLLKLPQTLAISLGPRIMRADTAAIAALTLVNSIFGDWNTRPRTY